MTHTADDRYQWLKSRYALTLSNDHGPIIWTRPDKSTFISSWYLAANGTQYPAAETLDEMIDAAMDMDEQEGL
jgi:hypothetical protein